MFTAQEETGQQVRPEGAQGCSEGLGETKEGPGDSLSESSGAPGWDPEARGFPTGQFFSLVSLPHSLAPATQDAPDLC